MNGVEKSGGRGRSRELESKRDGEREVLQTTTGWREGNLLVSSHQLSCGGDIKRMEGDASQAGREMKLRSVLTKEKD